MFRQKIDDQYCKNTSAKSRKLVEISRKYMGKNENNDCFFEILRFLNIESMIDIARTQQQIHENCWK